MSELVLKSVGLKRGLKTILSDSSATFKSGRITAILGLNGTGKTSILKLMSKELRCSKGNILVDGKKQYDLLKDVLYIPDRIIIPPLMKIEDLCELFVSKYPDYDSSYIDEICELLDIEKKEMLYKLSKGSQELVQLALLIAIKPKFLLLDEPLGAIDIVKREYVIKKMIDLQLEGTGIIITTHLIEQVSNLITDISFLKNGSLSDVIEVDTIYEEGYKDLFEYTYKALNEINF